MAGKNYDFNDVWGSLQEIVVQEAPTDQPPIQIQAFSEGIKLSYKEGEYTFPGGVLRDPDGSVPYADFGLDGWVEIPFCDGGQTSSTQYVFGYFDEMTAVTDDPASAVSIAMAQFGNGAEILREQVRAALATWGQCFGQVVSSQDFAVIMAPADQEWWWYVGQTGDQVGQLLTQNNARLTDISAYVDVDNTVKYAVIMAPADQEWWWYVGQTGDQVAQLLTQNNARLTDISAYVDVDNTVKYAVIMAPADQEWWWYVGQTGDQVAQLLTQNNARLTDISAYVDVDNTVKYAVIMAPADQEWWWYVGQTGDQVAQLLTQNNARLTDISAYVDVDNTVKYAVIMAPADQEWWWYVGQTGDQVAQLLTQNNARLTVLSPYPVSVPG